MANNNKDRVKIAGYAKREFYNDNIEYRNFSPNLVGNQIASAGGTPLFTNGNFSIDANLDPKPNVVFQQGTQSPYYTKEDVVSDNSEVVINSNINTSLNLDLSNPLTYIWYGSASELIRASLEEVSTKWPAAIYVDSVVGSISGNNITNYTYDINTDESTFTVDTSYFNNPYGVNYTADAVFTGTSLENTTLRNFTIKHKSYVVEHNGIIKKIKDIIPAQQATNSTLTLVVEGNPFPELTGFIISQLTFLNAPVSGSIPFSIKPNEVERELFFTSLNDLQNNLLNRDTYPLYTSIITSPKITDQGVVVTITEKLTFPILSDGYNLNFFDSFYLSYLDKINSIGVNYDKTNTDLIVRKYTAEVISSFDTVPRGDGNNLVLDGEKATKLLRIYGVSFDEVKKYINGIKFAHVVTYDKKDNIPDSLVKDLTHMLGLDPTSFVTTNNLSKTVLPVPGLGSFSGSPKNMSNKEVDTELYRRLILNIAWIWKSKGTRKAIEFLFRFIGAPEALVNFNEYIVIVDKPLDMNKIKELLLFYTGDTDTSHIPYDDNGFPTPPKNGDLVILDFVNGPTTGNTAGIIENPYTEMYFQKAGGWYKETFGENAGVTNLKGNNPHVGSYDGGNEYLNYFSKCYIPNFSGHSEFNLIESVNKVNNFINYNYGIFNNVTTNTFFTEEILYDYNSNTIIQNIEDCLEVSYSLIDTPIQPDGKSVLEQIRDKAEYEYNQYLEQIKLYPFLRYSQQFIIIKNNYEEASKNYNEEIRTENCNTNLSLEICVVESIKYDDEEKNPIVDCCGDIKKIYKEGFLILIDAKTGEKLSGNKYECCCNSSEVDGLPGKFISYKDGDRIIEYCGVEPCTGEPKEVKEDGTVVFELVGNNLPNDIVVVDDGCYQLCSDDGSHYQYQSSEYCRKIIGYDINESPEKVSEWAQKNNGSKDFYNCFKRADAGTDTIVSSPECCAWYGYESKIKSVKNNDGTITEFVICVDEVDASSLPSRVKSVDTEINVKLTELHKMEKDLQNTQLPSKENQKVNISIIQKKEEIIDLENKKELLKVKEELNILPPLSSGYDNYKPYSNRNASIDKISSLSTRKSLINEVAITKSNGNSKPGEVTTDFYSTFEDPDLNNANKWSVESIDNYGRVSFSVTDEKENKHILDWNTPKDSGGDLYNNIGVEKGFEYGTFEINPVNNKLTKIPNNGGTQSKKPYYEPPTTDAVVKPGHIQCEDINDVTILFGSENDLGFQLPEEKDCECSVDITFDYLLKYNTDNLIECVGESVECEVAIINDATINNIYCYNFITFTDEENSKVLEKYSPTSEKDNGSNIKVWQKTPQIEPSLECCSAMGGTIVEVDERNWYSYIKVWNENIQKEYINLYLTQIPDVLPSFSEPMIATVNNLILVEKEINSLFESGCLSYTHIPKSENICEYPPFKYITTQEICALPLKITCGLWTKLRHDYESFAIQLKSMITETEECIKNRDKYSDIKSETDSLIVDTETNKNTNTYETEKNVKSLNDDISVMDKSISDLDLEIESKQNDNNTIRQSLGDTQPSKDCTIYEDTIKQLNGFNVESFCRNENSGRVKEGTEIYNTAYQSCVKTKTLSVSEDIKTYTELLNLCNQSNELNSRLIVAKNQNNQVKIDLIEKDLENVNKRLNTLLNGVNGVVNNNENLQSSKQQNNDTVAVTERTSKILGKSVNDITDSSGNLKLNSNEKVSLKTQESRNNGEINKLKRKKEELVAQRNEKETSKQVIETEYKNKDKQYNEDLDVYKGYKEEKKYDLENQNSVCCEEQLNQLEKTLQSVNEGLKWTHSNQNECYSKWYEEIRESLNTINENSGGNYVDYVDDLKLNFKLFVDNNGIKNLPYTSEVNPIWEWDTTNDYSGVYFEGSEIDVTEVEQGILSSIISNKPSSTFFEPQWSTLNFSLPECLCKDLRRLYPNKRFKIGIEIENFECAVCLVVDNIKVNITDCDTTRRLSFNNCMIPDLSCVIDNRKSWVYYGDGVVDETIYPDGVCNTASTNNYNITKLTEPQNRLWKELEYRYTEYDVNHSDLILNTKSATFAIDPANAIECDVYNFWKNIDCDECPTSCESGSTVTYEGSVRDSGSSSLSAYTFTLSANTGGLPFSCDTITNTLEEQIIELKNDYYVLTSDYNATLNASYTDLLNKGGSLSEFKIENNNCNTNNIVIGNYKDVNSLFTVITEDEDGTLSLYENYIYDDVTPYIGGSHTEILSGYTAQTFNQTTGMTIECCTKLNELISDKGVKGLGLEKNYNWDSTTSECRWLEIENEKGDCTYCSNETVASYEECKNPCISGYTYNSDSGLCEREVDCDEYLTILSNQFNNLYDEKNDIESEIENLVDIQKARQSLYEDLKQSLEQLLNELQEVIDLNPTAVTVGDLSGTSYYPLTTYFSPIIDDINDILSNLEDEGVFWADGWNNILTELGNDSSVLTDLEDDINTYISFIATEMSQIREEYESQRNTLIEQLESIDEQLDTIKQLNATIQEECDFDPSSLFTLTSSIITVTGTTKEICVNPLDYLDVNPSDIQIKEVFDELVSSNLIDAKNRQVISGYPMLQLFYLLYLNANNCGKDLTGKLTYNSLFEFMDQIGDYWLDLLEQVVPATTIWEGCDNSGKIYRNTIFDQNKYAYRRYVLNFNDSEICPLSGITNDSIGSANVYVEVNETSLTPETEEIKKLKSKIREIEKEIFDITQKIEEFKCRLEVLLLISNPTESEATEIKYLEEKIIYFKNNLEELSENLKKLNKTLSKLQQELIQNQEEFNDNVKDCYPISEQLTKAKDDLEQQYIVGTVEYERQRNYIAGLENEYRKCVRKSKTQISNYDTVFITHINDSNEYEGNVTVIGDPEWSPGGYFYQSELIHNCGPSSETAAAEEVAEEVSPPAPPAPPAPCTPPTLFNGINEICDEGGGIATFNLDMSEGNIAPFDYTTATFEWFEDVGLTTPITTTSSYVSSDTTIYVKVTDASGCENTATLGLVVANIPNIFSGEYYVCDEGGGQATFDLNSVETDIAPFDPTATFEWFEDVGLTTPITNTTNYVSSDTIIYVRVTIEDSIECSDVTTMDLNVSPLPVLSPVTINEVNEGSGQATFDLTAEEANIAPSDYTTSTFAYWEDAGLTTSIPVPSSYVSSTGTIYVSVTKDNGSGKDCTDSTTINLVVLFES